MMQPYFLSFYGLSLYCFHSVLGHIQKFNYEEVNFVDVFVCCLCIWYQYLKTHCLIWTYNNLYLYFIPRFCAFIHYIQNLIHSELVFVYDLKWRFVLMLFIWVSHCSSIICWKDCYFPIEWSCHSSLKIGVDTWVYLGLYPICLYVYHVFIILYKKFYTVTVNFEVRKSKYSNLLFPLQDHFGYLGSFEFPCEFYDQLV